MIPERAQCNYTTYGKVHLIIERQDRISKGMHCRIENSELLLKSCAPVSSS